MKYIAAALITSLLVLFSASPAFSEPSKRVVVLETMTAPIVQQFTDAFLWKFKALEKGGPSPAQISRYNAGGSRDNATAFLEKTLGEYRPDLVVSVATLASKAAMEILAEKGIPLVFMCVTDPVGAGLVAEIGKPTGTFVTGKVHYLPVETKLEIVSRVMGKRIKGRAVRFGYIYTDYPADLGDFRRLQQAAAQRDDITFISHKIPYKPVSQYKHELLTQVRAAAKALENRVDYFWSPRGVLAVLPGYDKILIFESPVPLVVGATEESVRAGALLHITGDPGSQGEDCAAIARAVLSNTHPGVIPPSLPSRIEFAVNLKTAAQLQWAIPSDLMELARGHVYK